MYLIMNKWIMFRKIFIIKSLKKVNYKWNKITINKYVINVQKNEVCYTDC